MARAPPDSALVPAPAPRRPGSEPRRCCLLGRRPSSAPRPARPQPGPLRAPGGGQRRSPVGVGRLTGWVRFRCRGRGPSPCCLGFVLFMSFLTGSRKSRDSPPSRGPRRGGGRRGPAGLGPIAKRSAAGPIKSSARQGTPVT